MKKTIIILLGSIYFMNAYSYNEDCDIDSLFKANFTYLQNVIGDSQEDAIVLEENCVKFLYVVSLLSEENFSINPHNVTINNSILSKIKHWYQVKREYITCEKLEKAYSLLIPPLFKSHEDIEEYSIELEKLKIRD